MITETELDAIRKYLHHLAENWWDSEPESRTTAICDACSAEDIKRNEGYLIGSYLWGEECFNRKAIRWIGKDGPDKMLGYGVLAKAMQMFGEKEDDIPQLLEKNISKRDDILVRFIPFGILVVYCVVVFELSPYLYRIGYGWLSTTIIIAPWIVIIVIGILGMRKRKE